MTINIDKEVEVNFEFSEEEYIEKVILASMDYVECPYEAEVNVLFTDNAGIHEMNLEYRNIDRPTDVLSFPMVSYEIAGNFDKDSINPQRKYSLHTEYSHMRQTPERQTPNRPRRQTDS